ncbi:MAG: metallophosphoesterase [Candidatus Omnitrophica bacterium]|nr:metallophosphoesterase [Candidatus Omnitrophota bacterium]
MKIGVISDTHIPITAATLPCKACDYFKNCDLIVHAGDIVDESVVKKLETLAETKAVAGNMDSCVLKNKLPEKILFEVEGKKIGVIHGTGPKVKIKERVRKAFKCKPDVIIFGHSHVPLNEEDGGILFFNPGSATDSLCACRCTFGIIEIKNGEIRAKIIDCD